MEPKRYRKAYEAMLHGAQLLEKKLQENSTDHETEQLASISHFEEEDSMDWEVSADTQPPPASCGLPTTSTTNLNHLLPGDGNGDYRLEDPSDNSILAHKLQEGAIVDDCVEKIVRDLPEILNYENSPTFTPSTIEVPRDFGLQLSISINHHLAQVADRKVLEKYRRLLGHRKDPKRKSLKLGFDPIDLIKKQAVHFSESALSHVSTLDNAIHPIFRVDNFHGCSDAIYTVLKPALRLATHFMFSRGTSTFWHTLVFGDRQPCPETSEQYGQPCCRIREDVAWTDEHARTFRSFVDEQLDTIHFMFHRDPLPPDPAYASMGLVQDYKNGLIRKLDRKCHTSRICLHADFYTTAKKLSLLQYPDPAMVLRFNLFLAVCLAHEMAHFIEVSGPHHEHPLGEPEVFFNDNKWTESGIAFEVKTFGGRLHPISSRVDCGLGLAVLNYPLKELYDKEDNVLYTLPMDYVTRIQQKETWEQDFSKAGIDAFCVPRTGCRSIEVNGTNLMIWEDESLAEISDHVDGKDTLYFRMDDGNIVKNPNSSNRRPNRSSQERRWSPYGRQKKTGIEEGACVSKEVVEPDGAIDAVGEQGVQPKLQPTQGHESEVDGDQDML